MIETLRATPARATSSMAAFTAGHMPASSARTKTLLRFVYHNHDFEFAPLDGSTMWHLLAAETHPALVGFELDLYWALAGGCDPVREIDALAGRVPLVHVKDRADGTTVPVGTGELDWPAILRTCEDAGVQWYVIEQDRSDDPLADVRTSLENLLRWVR